MSMLNTKQDVFPDWTLYRIKPHLSYALMARLKVGHEKLVIGHALKGLAFDHDPVMYLRIKTASWLCTQ